MTETTEGEPNHIREGLPYGGAEVKASTVVEARRLLKDHLSEPTVIDPDPLSGTERGRPSESL